MKKFIIPSLLLMMFILAIMPLLKNDVFPKLKKKVLDNSSHVPIEKNNSGFRYKPTSDSFTPVLTISEQNKVPFSSITFSGNNPYREITFTIEEIRAMTKEESIAFLFIIQSYTPQFEHLSHSLLFDLLINIFSEKEIYENPKKETT